MNPNPVNPNSAPVNPASVNPSSPIADLSYRTYDGPLHTRTARWWIVALANIRMTLRNKWYWVLGAGAFVPYIFQGIAFYVTNLMKNAAPMADPDSGPGALMMQEAHGRKFALLFYQGFTGWELLFLLGIALMVGAGSIANDNRANALQVYLSKPITKGDYLLGKWMSVFLPVAAAALAPALLFYAFLGTAYGSDGFFKSDPSLIGRVVLATILPGILHASLLTGLSAWSKTARIAGALYAALYFVGVTVTSIIWGIKYNLHPTKGLLLQHMSLPGLLTGLAQNIYHVTIRRPVFFKRHGSLEILSVKPPDLWVMVAVMAAVCIIGIAAARWRIRAVEVVRG